MKDLIIMNKSLPSHLGCITVCFIPVETLVVCKATSHIECHRHLADADTERESKIAVYIQLYLLNSAPAHHKHLAAQQSDEFPRRTASFKNTVYILVITVCICNK